MKPDDSEYVLEMKGITKLFPGVRALDGVDLRVRKAEIHALIGENGAGKSTLMNILLGLFPQDEGDIFYRGNKVSFKNPHEALTAGISMIHQEISLIPSMDVAENIWIGREREFKKLGLISLKKRYRATEELLEHIGIKIPPKTIVQTLSVANMQLVELARAVSYNPRIVIMDEPTSSLTETEIQFLYKVIRELSAEGTAVIFISHKLEEIYEICSRVTVMRDGRFISETPVSDLSMDQLINQIAGRTIKDMFPKAEANIKDVALEVKGFCSGKSFQDISFTVRRGEILGVCGLVGAGRTEIMRAVFGIDPVDSGEIFLDGEKVRIRSPKDAIKHGLAMITEDRRRGIVPNLPVRHNISLAALKTYCNKIGFIKIGQENQGTAAMADKLAVKAASYKQVIASLSGGNQQKAIIAKWLLTRPRVLILDEPTRGIDVGSKSEIHRLISQLAREGLAVIMVSSEMPEVLGMSDRILAVRNGRLAGEFNRGSVTQETLTKHLFGA
ncbi:putative ribose/galactose/methyl galactoside import ATP-binding protein [Spirochaetia bacterium]|nr:putative ribose/galactose/methyl galactoside import ATP-binding protein [Spirochaetia bacterium]